MAGQVRISTYRCTETWKLVSERVVRLNNACIDDSMPRRYTVGEDSRIAGV